MELLDEIADPGSCEIQEYKRPLCFEVYPQFPVRSKDNSSYVVARDKTHGDDLNLFLSGDFSDIEIRFQDSVFQCHKCILASRCERFKIMFSSPFAESNGAVVPISPAAPTCTATDIRAMLCFIYSDELPEATTRSPSNLLQLADEFMLPRLKELCEKELIRKEINLDIKFFNTGELIAGINKAIGMFCFARCYNATQLADVLYITLANKPKVLNSTAGTDSGTWHLLAVETMARTHCGR
jgi:hypothetical protein